MKPDETIQHDEHLRAALRHAPDADAAAPADISAQIIAAAHRSAGERATPPTHAPAARSRWWLQPWGASGALATVLMAGVIGLMWRGEAPGPARESAAPKAAPQAAPMQTSVPVPVALPTSAPAPATADARANSPAPAAPKPRVLAAAPSVRPPTKAAAQPMAPEPSETVASARDAATAMEAAPQSAPAPAALSPAPAALSRLRAQTTPTVAQAAPSLAQPPPWRDAPQLGDQLSWQPADRLLPPDAAWLARLAQLSAGRWQPLAATPTTAEVAQLHWQRSGASVGRLGFDLSSVWWCSPLPACHRAPLDALTLRELLAQLAR